MGKKLEDSEGRRNNKLRRAYDDDAPDTSPDMSNVEEKRRTKEQAPNYDTDEDSSVDVVGNNSIESGSDDKITSEGVGNDTLENDSDISYEEEVEPGALSEESQNCKEDGNQENEVTTLSGINDEDTSDDEDANALPTTTSRAGRSIRRINYKDLSQHGLQFVQEASKNETVGTKSSLVNHDMFKRVNKITMLTLNKGHEYDQLNVKQGIKVYGAKAVAAVIKEYEQLRDLDTVAVMDPKTLSYAQKTKALELLTDKILI